jgi:hypothetical protein
MVSVVLWVLTPCIFGIIGSTVTDVSEECIRLHRRENIGSAVVGIASDLSWKRA